MLFRDKLRRYKADMIVTSVLCALLGVALLVWPDKAVDLLCRALAIFIIIIALVQMSMYSVSRGRDSLALMLGCIMILVGAWMFFRPQEMAKLVPIGIGVILIVHGMQDFLLSVESRENGYERWWIMIIIAAFSIFLGIVCIVNAFGFIKLTFRLIGLSLLFDGLTDLWIAIKAAWLKRIHEKDEAALECEYREVD